jgi:RNA polymerase sigma-70 factor (ECF subfamily)
MFGTTFRFMRESLLFLKTAQAAARPQARTGGENPSNSGNVALRRLFQLSAGGAIFSGYEPIWGADATTEQVAVSDSLTETSKFRKREEVAILRPFPASGNEQQLVDALRKGHPAATVHFYSMFAERVRRLLFRILGPDSELEDTLHDTFVRALESIHTLREASALRAWLLGVAVHTARIRIQSRQRRRWLTLVAPENIPEQTAAAPALEAVEALRAVARVLERLPTEERIAVVLRLAEHMTLPEAAAACGVSLSTFKRRFARGEKTFRELVSQDPTLRGWCSGDVNGL